MATLIRIYKDRISIRSGLNKEQATRKGEKFEKKNQGSPLWQVIDKNLNGSGPSRMDIGLAPNEPRPPLVFLSRPYNMDHVACLGGGGGGRSTGPVGQGAGGGSSKGGAA